MLDLALINELSNNIDMTEDKFQEECGVFGIYDKTSELDVASLTYYGLYALQHRGQESAGIVVNDGEKMNCHKNMGLVADIFNQDMLSKMPGKSAIGHVRYSTAGGSTVENAQPLVGQYKGSGLAIAHNGTLVNADIIREMLNEMGYMFQTSIDSEVILNLIARGAKKGMEKAIVDTMQAIKGSYGITILTDDALIGVRDPQGIRPLCLGKIGEGYIVTSESCALDAVGAEFVRDIDPGEIVVINDEGIKSYNFVDGCKKSVCSFEYVYFARPDSIMDGVSVYESRIKAGEILYKEHPVEADIVVGVPDSGIPAAMGYSRASGIPFEHGLVKNRYIGRTFIAPSQELRERAVSVKLNALKACVEGKRVVLVDDSIVRGTTSKRLVEILKKAGAKEVHFLVSSPTVKYPCYFGIDTPYRKDLIGAKAENDEIRDAIGADSLGYISINGLLDTLGEGCGYCLGCFNGEYPMPPAKSEEDE